MFENIVLLGRFLKKIYTYRIMIKAMALRDIQSRYIGTLGGLAWSIIHPLMFIAIYWLVFSAGFKVKPPGGIPFIVVFLCGLIPWSMFAEALSLSSGAINANAHLVTKTVFPTEILPVVKIAASLITHFIMLGIFIIVMAFNHIPLSCYDFQFFYYLLGLMLLSLGLGWFLSAVNVFYKDVNQTLSVVLNLWFWVTPIVWSPDMLPYRYQILLKLNPMHYIVDGYRASFLYHSSILHNPKEGVYFWIVCLVTLLVGAITFKKLKPDFAEVL